MSAPLAGAGPDTLRKRLLATLAVLALGGLAGATQYRWMRENGFHARPPSSDATLYRIEAYSFLRALRDEGVGAWLTAIGRYDRYHPPLLQALGSLAGSSDGALGVRELQRVNLAFAALLAVGVYRLARRFLARPAAVGAVALALAAPAVLTSLRPFFPQLPMAACVVFALGELVRSRGFSKPGASAAAGAALGAAMLFKNLAPLYLAGGVLWSLTPRGGFAPRRRRVLGFLLFVGACVLVAGPWYVAHWNDVLAYVERVVGAGGQARYSKGVALWTAERWLYYAAAFVGPGVAPPFAAAVAVALLAHGVRALRPRLATASRSAGAVVATVVVAYPTLTIGQVAGFAYYLLPLVPLGALAVATAVSAIPRPAVRAAAWAVAAAAAAFGASLALRPFTEDCAASARAPERFRPRVERFVTNIAEALSLEARPDAEPWPLAEFADAIAADPRTSVARIGLTADLAHPYVMSHNLAYELGRRGRLGTSVNLHRLSTATAAEARTLLTGVDYLVVSDFRASNAKPREGTVGAALPADPARCVETLRRLTGVPLRLVAERRVTATSAVGLAVVERLAAPPCAAPASALADPHVGRIVAPFDNGWSLQGAELAPTGQGRAVVRTFWKVREASRTPVVLSVGVFGPDGRTALARTRRPVAAPPGAELSDLLALTTDEFAIPPDGVPSTVAVALLPTDGTNVAIVVRGRDHRGRPTEAKAVRVSAAAAAATRAQ